MVRVSDGTFELASGRRLDFDDDVICLSVGDGQPVVLGGFDYGFCDIGVTPDNPLTEAERTDLADYMIEQWQLFKARGQ